MIKATKTVELAYMNQYSKFATFVLVFINRRAKHCAINEKIPEIYQNP